METDACRFLSDSYVLFQLQQPCGAIPRTTHQWTIITGELRAASLRSALYARRQVTGVQIASDRHRRCNRPTSRDRRRRMQPPQLWFRTRRKVSVQEAGRKLSSSDVRSTGMCCRCHRYCAYRVTRTSFVSILSVASLSDGRLVTALIVSGQVFFIFLAGNPATTSFRQQLAPECATFAIASYVGRRCVP
jgi:hypothetical protein